MITVNRLLAVTDADGRVYCPACLHAVLPSAWEYKDKPLYYWPIDSYGRLYRRYGIDCLFEHGRVGEWDYVPCCDRCGERLDVPLTDDGILDWLSSYEDAPWCLDDGYGIRRWYQDGTRRLPPSDCDAALLVRLYGSRADGISAMQAAVKSGAIITAGPEQYVSQAVWQRILDDGEVVPPYIVPGPIRDIVS